MKQILSSSLYSKQPPPLRDFYFSTSFLFAIVYFLKQVCKKKQKNKTGMCILFNVAFLMYNWHTNCTVSIFIIRKRSNKYFKCLLELAMLLKRHFLIHPNYHYRGIVNIWLLLREVSDWRHWREDFPCRLWDNMVILYTLFPPYYILH